MGQRPGLHYALAMCGRVRCSPDVRVVKLVFSIPPHRPDPNIASRLERGWDRSAPGGFATMFCGAVLSPSARISVPTIPVR
jgi:hypothetical protein